jgi:hypothetical protein
MNTWYGVMDFMRCKHVPRGQEEGLDAPPQIRKSYYTWATLKYQKIKLLFGQRRKKYYGIKNTSIGPQESHK